ncbi:hypothetical protein ASE04_18090 [Rhizobium sp. Root708]|uniref:hypothetical protein n=1 Tax=Rhizobium sp. Root708 TaxID=1736592 RepID=UPI0006F8FF62|nr:hypothetical protein [Rhizobium sp. Root708]KRB49098.1 hypothetical protein ASE04_18090 [Rhizobium sp. Root708]
MTKAQVASDHRTMRARRVVTGVDAQGRSTFVSDEVVEERFVGDAFTVNMVWRVGGIPIPVDAIGAFREITNVPPERGFNFFITTFPPDSSWDYSKDYAKSLTELQADAAAGSQDDPSMHATNTLDIIVVISGEVFACVETGEILLRQGDTLIQRGTKHTWHNRTSSDCVVAAFMASAKR